MMGKYSVQQAMAELPSSRKITVEWRRAVHYPKEAEQDLMLLRRENENLNWNIVSDYKSPSVPSKMLRIILLLVGDGLQC